MEKDWKVKFDKWLDNLGKATLKELHHIVEILETELELEEVNTFNIPYNKFEDASIPKGDVLRLLLKLDTYQVIALYKTEVPDFEGMPSYDTETGERIYENILSFSDDVTLNKGKFDYLYKTLEKKQAVGRLEKSFWFDELTFNLRRVDGSSAVINFYPRKGETTDPYCLLYVLIEVLKKDYRRSDNRLEVIVSQETIRNQLKKSFPKIGEVDNDWIKGTKGNLIKKIPEEFKNLIKVENFNRKFGGYPFSIEVPF